MKSKPSYQSYSTKLKDPRWQKLRLKVMERDSFTCRYCLSQNKTLNVHHGYYESNLNPWDYDIETLHTVCEDCHEKIKLIMRDIHYQIAKIDLNYLENNVMQFLLSIKGEIEKEILEVSKFLKKEGE